MIVVHPIGAASSLSNDTLSSIEDLVPCSTIPALNLDTQVLAINTKDLAILCWKRHRALQHTYHPPDIHPYMPIAIRSYIHHNY